MKSVLPGHVVLSDINESMLNVGRDRLIDAGCTNVDFVLANAETLEPFEDNSFDLLTISFGLRNVTDKDAAPGCHVPCAEARWSLTWFLNFQNRSSSHSPNCTICTHSQHYQSWVKLLPMTLKVINT